MRISFKSSCNGCDRFNSRRSRANVTAVGGGSTRARTSGSCRSPTRYMLLVGTKIKSPLPCACRKKSKTVIVRFTVDEIGM
jgi:hypothetical protein